MGRLAHQGGSEREQKDQVHALVLKGKFDEALVILRGLVAANAKEPALRLQLAEVQRKRGLLDEAVASYVEASALMEAAGYTARARAALSCALQLAPGEPVLVAAQRALQPPSAPRHLALVPPPPAPVHAAGGEPWVLGSGFDGLDDEPRTEPFCPVFDWLGDDGPTVPMSMETVVARHRRAGR